MGSFRLGIDIDRALRLRSDYHLKAFIETGTYKMGSTMLAQPYFERIITIEGYEPRYRKNMAQINGNAPRNVEFWFGDSRTELAKALTAVDCPALLWLDAHWCGNTEESFRRGDECPLREELAAVLASKYADRHVIMIDDARLFKGELPANHNPAQWMSFGEIKRVLRPRVPHIIEDVIYVEPVNGARR